MKILFHIIQVNIHYIPDPNPIVTLTSDQAAKLQKLN